LGSWGCEAIEDGAQAVARLEIDTVDFCWIGALLEVLWDSVVELGVDGRAYIRLRFKDDALCIICDDGVSLFLVWVRDLWVMTSPAMAGTSTVVRWWLPGISILSGTKFDIVITFNIHSFLS